MPNTNFEQISNNQDFNNKISNVTMQKQYDKMKEIIVVLQRTYRELHFPLELSSNQNRAEQAIGLGVITWPETQLHINNNVAS